MRFQPLHALAAFSLLSLVSWRAPLRPDATTTVRQVANGITLTQEISTGAVPLMIYALHVDRHAAGVRIQAAQALDVVSYTGAAQGRETMSHMAARTGAVAAINGDFFPFNGDPTSLEIRDGELISEPIGYRVAVGLTRDSALMQILTSHGTVQSADKTQMLLNGINHLPHDGETVLLTSAYAPAAKPKQTSTVVILTGVSLPFHVSRDLTGHVDAVATLPPNQPLPPCPRDGILIVGTGAASAPLAAHCTVGDTVHVRYDLLAAPSPAANSAPPQADPPPVWQDVDQAIGGGPWLVRDGKVYVDGDAERLSPADFVNARHARSACGICKDGSLLLVAVDGRKATSRGVTLPEMAEILLRFGAQQAINLDGGGSTDLVVAGAIVNTPSDGRERPVANGLLVFANAPQTEATARPVSAPSAPAGSGP